MYDSSNDGAEDAESKRMGKENEMQLASSFGSFEDVEMGISLLVIHFSVTMVVFIGYILSVASKYTFRYGYANPNPGNESPPGHFVDERFSLIWVMFFINCLRAISYFFYVWIADCRVYSWWLFGFQKFMAVFFVVFDFLYLLDLLILGVQCNASYFPSNPCNDPNGYCKAYDYPDQCPASSYDPNFDPGSLRTNGAFARDCWFSVAFAINDILILVSSSAFRLTVRRFAQISLLRMGYSGGGDFGNYRGGQRTTDYGK